jgi:hypothetical protein
MNFLRYVQTLDPPADVMINFRVGYPSPDVIPIEMIRKATKVKLYEQDPTFFM